jgi:hypothetical protein
MIDPNKPPKSPCPPGFHWEYRSGCDCAKCPWKGNCRGETWAHWLQVPDLDNTLCPKVGAAQWACTKDECMCHLKEGIK